ncbi:hypothetical protein IE81DRAFT_324428 [Ceraceosorus guamensis]|uniref:Uncharacterized protein n=1 Tax=Ceraceosorus guamensis TaxID=1522189 RepID=A0A316VVQ1_9BASI|nr:hypothetical protein IE81DRAFT_324428 [Ceraceosorus guamensis]PWN41570.1 hypothetical protein IE81DRAFT_324428 [Ceraceosorus guamensis]
MHTSRPSSSARHSVGSNAGNGFVYGGAGSHVASSPGPASPTSPAPTGAFSAHDARTMTDSPTVVMSNIGSILGRRHSAAAGADRDSPSRMSVGDDLPHMPAAPPSRQTTLSPPINYSQPKWAPPATMSAAISSAQVGWAGEDYDSEYHSEKADAMLAGSPRETAYTQADSKLRRLRGQSVLLEREAARVRDKGVQKLRMRWRVLAGTTVLLLLTLSAYVLARYILAFLNLSPATFLLSDAADGTSNSPDPQLRMMALIAVIVSAMSTAGVLASGVYLRFSRKTSCGTYFIWITAIVSTTMSVALCVVNLALILLWHQRYTSGAGAGSPLAATRDVGQRCAGNWDMDILWSAAESSPIAKVDKDNTNCSKDPAHTLRMFLIAAGVRLGLFVLFSAFWMAALGRYNTTLKCRNAADGDLPLPEQESAEMHRLLQLEHADDQKTLDSVPGAWKGSVRAGNTARGGGFKSAKFGYDEETLRGAAPSPADFQEVRKAPIIQTYGDGGLVGEADDDGLEPGEEIFAEKDVVGGPSHRGAGHVVFPEPETLAPPKLQRFAWQRERSRSGYEPAGAVEVYGNMAPRREDDDPSAFGHGHGKESSAGGWGAGMLGRVWDSFWATPAVQDASEHPHDLTRTPAQTYRDSFVTQYERHADVPHSAQIERFDQRKEDTMTPADHLSTDHERGPSKLGISGWFRRDASQASGGVGEGAQDVGSFPSSREQSLAPTKHARTPSQERRASQARHAAAARLAVSDSSRDGATALSPRSRSRSELRAREEQASWNQQRRKTSPSPSRGAHDASGPTSSRRSSSSLGDELPHMPSLMHLPAQPTSRASQQPNLTAHQPSSTPSSERSSEEFAGYKSNDPAFMQRRGYGSGVDGYSSAEDDYGSDQGHGYGSGHPYGLGAGEEDDADFWDPNARLENTGRPAPVQETPVYVRTLGKLVRKLSAIASVGSEEKSVLERSGSNASAFDPYTASGSSARRARSRSHHSRGPSAPYDIVEEGEAEDASHARPDRLLPGGWRGAR